MKNKTQQFIIDEFNDLRARINKILCDIMEMENEK